jgi:hypothetical protein
MAKGFLQAAHKKYEMYARAFTRPGLYSGKGSVRVSCFRGWSTDSTTLRVCWNGDEQSVRLMTLQRDDATGTLTLLANTNATLLNPCSPSETDARGRFCLEFAAMGCRCTRWTRRVGLSRSWQHRHLRSTGNSGDFADRGGHWTVRVSVESDSAGDAGAQFADPGYISNRCKHAGTDSGFQPEYRCDWWICVRRERPAAPWRRGVFEPRRRLGVIIPRLCRTQFNLTP